MATIIAINNVTGLSSALARSQKQRRAVNDVDATLAKTDYLIAYSAISAARAITLPAASTCKDKHFVIKDESGSANSSTKKITFVGTVDGASNPDAITAAYGIKKIYSNGTAWFGE